MDKNIQIKAILLNKSFTYIKAKIIYIKIFLQHFGLLKQLLPKAISHTGYMVYG